MLLYLPVSCGCINLYLNVLFYGLREIIVRKRKKKLFASRFRGSRPLVALARRSFRVDVAVAHRTEGHGLLHVGIIMIPSLFGYDGRHLSVEVFQRLGRCHLVGELLPAARDHSHQRKTRRHCGSDGKHQKEGKKDLGGDHGVCFCCLKDGLTFVAKLILWCVRVYVWKRSISLDIQLKSGSSFRVYLSSNNSCLVHGLPTSPETVFRVCAVLTQNRFRKSDPCRFTVRERGKNGNSGCGLSFWGSPPRLLRFHAVTDHDYSPRSGSWENLILARINALPRVLCPWSRPKRDFRFDGDCAPNRRWHCRAPSRMVVGDDDPHHDCRNPPSHYDPDTKKRVGDTAQTLWRSSTQRGNRHNDSYHYFVDTAIRKRVIHWIEEKKRLSEKNIEHGDCSSSCS